MTQTPFAFPGVGTLRAPAGRRVDPNYPQMAGDSYGGTSSGDTTPTFHNVTPARPVTNPPPMQFAPSSSSYDGPFMAPQVRDNLINAAKDSVIYSPGYNNNNVEDRRRAMAAGATAKANSLAMPYFHTPTYQQDQAVASNAATMAPQFGQAALDRAKAETGQITAQGQAAIAGAGASQQNFQNMQRQYQDLLRQHQEAITELNRLRGMQGSPQAAAEGQRKAATTQASGERADAKTDLDRQTQIARAAHDAFQSGGFNDYESAYGWAEKKFGGGQVQQQPNPAGAPTGGAQKMDGAPKNPPVPQGGKLTSKGTMILNGWEYQAGPDAWHAMGRVAPETRPIQ